MVEALNSAHINEITRLHLRNLTGLLRELGPAATGAYYLGAARSSTAIGFVQVQQDRVVGFILGSANPRKMKREILSHSFFRTLVGVCAGIIRKPRMLRVLLTSLFTRVGDFDADGAELIYLAVDEDQREMGAGKQLVERFIQKLSDLNVSSCELSVDAENLHAIRFYERLGFTEVGRYSEFGIGRKRYRKELA